ncbi:hypothetical protein [Xanthomonas campestris]|nr:hypothetical protein [Xanthomonas campestris]
MDDLCYERTWMRAARARLPAQWRARTNDADEAVGVDIELD